MCWFLNNALIILSGHCIEAGYGLVLKSDPDASVKDFSGWRAQIKTLVRFSSRKHRKCVQAKIFCCHLAFLFLQNRAFSISRAVSLRCESSSAECSLVAFLWLWLGQVSLTRDFSNELLGQTHTGETEGSIQPLGLLVVFLLLFFFFLAMF